MPTIDLATFDLAQLPSTEDDEFEFKSSATPPKELKRKLACAVSGFANSGGGVFVAGVDEDGNADGGVPLRINRQDVRDWTDQVVHRVEPPPTYDVKLIDDPAGRGSINPDCGVLVVVIQESYIGPHQAPDNRYYIRAGAHTVPARHFIIEAIWATRHFSKPRLTHIFRLKPGVSEVVQIGIVSLTDSPALNVEFELSPLPEQLRKHQNDFPLLIPMVNRQNPFFLDVALWSAAEDDFGQNVILRVHYEDLAANRYSYEPRIDIGKSITSMRLGLDPSERIARSLESIQKTLKSGAQPPPRYLDQF